MVYSAERIAMTNNSHYQNIIGWNHRHTRWFRRICPTTIISNNSSSSSILPIDGETFPSKAAAATDEWVCTNTTSLRIRLHHMRSTTHTIIIREGFPAGAAIPINIHRRDRRSFPPRFPRHDGVSGTHIPIDLKRGNESHHKIVIIVANNNARIHKNTKKLETYHSEVGVQRHTQRSFVSRLYCEWYYAELVVLGKHGMTYYNNSLEDIISI
jgi:hypothetical protein